MTDKMKQIKHGHPVCVLMDRLTFEVKYVKHIMQNRKRHKTMSSQDEIPVKQIKMEKNYVKRSMVTLDGSSSENSDSEYNNENIIGKDITVKRKKELQTNSKVKKGKDKSVVEEENMSSEDIVFSGNSEDELETVHDPKVNNDMAQNKLIKIQKRKKDESAIEHSSAKKNKNLDNETETIKIKKSKEKKMKEKIQSSHNYVLLSDISKKDDIFTNNETCNGLLDANSFFNVTVDSLKENAISSSSDEESDSEEKKVKKKKKLTTSERQEEMRKEEEYLRQNESKLAESYDNPQTADHFDRLLLANPDSSITWINYMAFHLQATEIEKARAVARKALSSISLREEQEKMNVWIALLNLENRYGTKESFSEVMEEALRMNDAYAVHMQVLQILAESSKVQDLADMVNKVLKKYRSNIDTWINAGLACFKAGLVEKARQIMQKGMSGLENKQHVDLIVRFATLENRFGHSERAQALMEQVLTSYPRRVDIWSQYIDMLVKSSQITIAREVLERAVTQKLPARKMKTIFKKFLDFETKYGDAELVTKVREMASEYVKRATN